MPVTALPLMLTSQLPLSHRRSAAFSLIEAIFTIAIIGIMSSIVVSAINNASRDANRVVARQQQATLQSALQSWVLGNMRVVGGADDGILRSVEDLRSAYNNAPTTSARFQLVAPPIGEGYLDPITRDHFAENSTNTNRLETAALKASRQHFTLPTWQSGEFPRALLQDN